MIKEKDFYNSRDLGSNFLATILYTLFIISDYLIVTFLFIYGFLYLPEKLNVFMNFLFGNNDSVLLFGLMNTLSNFTISIFIYVCYKKIIGFILSSNSITKYYYIKYLSFYFGKDNFWKFSNEYNFTKKTSNIILILTLLFSLLGSMQYSSIDKSGVNKHIGNYKFQTIPWSKIDKIEYKLILWFDQRRSTNKLREKFIISGTFGELDIMDYGNSEKIIEIIQFVKKYGIKPINSDNPNDPSIKEFLENYNQKEKQRIFKIYNEIYGYY